MTTRTGPADLGQARPQTGIPADDVPGQEVDVRYLAGQRLPAAGAWLGVTTAEAGPEGEFTAVFLPVNQPHAHGGDVLIWVSPATSDGDWDIPQARVRVVAAVAGSLVLAAGWDRLDLDSWPERVRATAAFTRGVLGELRDHGADLGSADRVEVESAAIPAAGFPGLPAAVSPR